MNKNNINITIDSIDRSFDNIDTSTENADRIVNYIEIVVLC